MSFLTPEECESFVNRMVEFKTAVDAGQDVGIDLDEMAKWFDIVCRASGTTAQDLFNKGFNKNRKLIGFQQP